jgi:hypothetical protein
MADRIEIGVMKLEGDWRGIFIRGDDALAYARRLRGLLAKAEERAGAGEMPDEEASAWSRLSSLAELLESCRAPTTRMSRAPD